MFESLTRGEKVAAGAAGAAIVIAAAWLVRKRAGAAVPPRVGLDPELPSRHERVVRAALTSEQDPAVLHALAAKLGAAGYPRSATAALRRAGELSPIIAAGTCAGCGAASRGRPAPVWWAAGDFSVAGAPIAAGASAMRAGEGEGDVRGAQQILAQLGYHVGSPNGVLGSETRHALREFQRRHGLGQSGSLDPRTLAALATVAGKAG